MTDFKWGAEYMEISLTSADVTGILDKLSAMGIFLYNTRVTDELTVCFQVRRRDFRAVRNLAEKYGATAEVTSRRGFFRIVRTLAHRPLLVGGIALLLLFGAAVPERIFFVEVEGNRAIPTRLIVEAARESGVGFGADRREVRSEKVKNALLARIPELQWTGINTYGSRAVITVREREQTKEQQQQPGVSSIVSDRDGLILSCTTENGTALVTPGQAVKKGQILISGYTDCQLSIRATRAQGEVIAQTSREMTVLSPPE